MKRLWIGVALLLVVLTVAIGLTAAFSALHRPLAEMLEQASRAALAEDWDAAAELVEQASSRWDKYRDFTAAVADHEPLEEMDGLFAELTVLVQLQEEGNFTAGCVRLARLAEAMADSQAITWWNLL